MTATAAVVVIDVLVIGFLAYRLHRGIVRSMRWPEPIPRPYTCDRCLRAYRDTRTLSLHVQGEHPDVFEDGQSLGS